MRLAFLDAAIERLPFTPAHAVQFVADIAVLGLLGLPVVLAAVKLGGVVRRWLR